MFDLGLLFVFCFFVVVVVRVGGVVVQEGSIARGRVVKELVYSFDVMPTLLAIAGANTASSDSDSVAAIEAQSLIPFLTTPPPPTTRATARTALVSGREFVFSAYMEKMRMIRDKRFKLIEYYISKTTHVTQLFDMVHDPLEMTNLLHSKQQQQQQQQRYGDDAGDVVDVVQVLNRLRRLLKSEEMRLRSPIHRHKQIMQII